MAKDKKLTGKIIRVFYATPEFSSGKIRTDAGAVETFAGRFLARSGAEVTLAGSWQNHDKYGLQFKVDCEVVDLPVDPAGLKNYIAKHPEIKHIGSARAAKLVDEFAGCWEEALASDQEAMAKTAGVKPEVIEKLREEWARNAAMGGALAWLSAFGLTHHQVSTIIEKLGNNALPILQDNPYILITEIHGMAFKKVDLIARKMGTAKNLPARLAAGLLSCLDDAANQGDCWIEQSELIDRANVALALDDLDSKERIEAELERMINASELAYYSYDGRFLITRPAVLEMETALAKVFRRGENANPHFADEWGLEGLVEANGPTLNPNQKEALLSALQSGVSVMTGGAGSGKTFTIAVLTEICQEKELRIVLAAPTGKAAKRLEELAERDAMTIHRLLGFDGRVWAHDEDNPIDADFLVVDEASMIDVPLCWRLMKAVDLSRTAVLFVGDHNQLPPVGVGSVLRDLIVSRTPANTRAVPVTILDEVVRQAGALKENSVAILEGEVRKTSNPNEGRCRDWYLANKYTDPLAAQAFVLKMFDEELPKLGFDIVKDVQLITPTHKGPLGTRELNRKLQQLIQRQKYGFDVPRPKRDWQFDIYKNDKIIQTKNNYEIGIMNGAIGVVLEKDTKGTLICDFDGKEVEIKKGSKVRRDLMLAYALTIHKAQGSEFPCVVAVIHKSHSFQHHRNLFYTAVTRARQTAVIVGDQWGVKNCAKKSQADRRRTFLSLMLAGKHTG